MLGILFSMTFDKLIKVILMHSDPSSQGWPVEIHGAFYLLALTRSLEWWLVATVVDFTGLTLDNALLC